MGRIIWKDPVAGEKAQFIADILKESLFDYAFDSNKVPSLNLHYFAMDFLMTSARVDVGLIKEGNIIPLIEEFEYIIKESPWLPAKISKSVLCAKNKFGQSIDLSTTKNTDTHEKAHNYRESALYIKSLLQAKGNYLSMLLGQIKSIMNSSTFTINEQKRLYFCTREYTSELINIGVSKSYIYNRVQTQLFTCKKSKNDILLIMEFLQSLLPSKHTYDVVFGITDDVYFELKEVIQACREATDLEQKKLRSNYVVQIQIKALDPVSALYAAKDSFSSVLSIYNCCIHSSNIKTNPNGLVKIDESGKYKLINDVSNLLSKAQNKNKSDRIQWLAIAAKHSIASSLLSSFELHNNALGESKAQTQLLNLWTIIELLIETKQDQMSKVNYISNILCSILCSVYYKRSIESLYKQITTTHSISAIIGTETRGKNNIEKLAIILKDNSTLKAQIISNLSAFPLERYKIEYFSQIFSSKKNMQTDLERHSNRLRWQIMRIYRNRCMIVHNGSYCPYISNIVENLHYYVDELFNFIITRMSEGITDIKAIISYANINEHQRLQILKDDKTLLSDDQFLDLIFN